MYLRNFKIVSKLYLTLSNISTKICVPSSTGLPPFRTHSPTAGETWKIERYKSYQTSQPCSLLSFWVSTGRYLVPCWYDKGILSWRIIVDGNNEDYCFSPIRRINFSHDPGYHYIRSVHTVHSIHTPKALLQCSTCPKEYSKCRKEEEKSKQKWLKSEPYLL